jgi:hypothetical protein
MNGSHYKVCPTSELNHLTDTTLWILVQFWNQLTTSYLMNSSKMCYCCNTINEYRENRTQNRQQITCMRSDVLTAVKRLIMFFCVMVACSLVGGYQHFGRMYCLYLQLKMEAVCSSETHLLTSLHVIRAREPTVTTSSFFHIYYWHCLLYCIPVITFWIKQTANLWQYLCSLYMVYYSQFNFKLEKHLIV